MTVSVFFDYSDEFLNFDCDYDPKLGSLDDSHLS